MIDCSFKVQDAYNKSLLEINRIMGENYLESPSDLKNLQRDVFRFIKAEYTGISNEEEIQEYILLMHEKFLKLYKDDTDISLENNPQFTESILRDEFNSIINGVEGDTSTPPVSADLRTSPLESRNPNDSSLDFLTDFYGTATSVKDAALVNAKTHLFDALFLNRDITGVAYEEVRSNENLNNNIRRYHQHLFDKMLDYLRTVTGLDPDIQDLLSDGNLPLYVKDGGGWKDSGNFRKLYTYINRYLNPRILGSFSDLNSWYENPNDLLRLEAYNAYAMFSNFDSLLNGIFGDSIDINRFGFRDGSDKYTMKLKTADQIEHWGAEELRDPLKESDKIVKLLIETTLLLDENGNPRPNQYLPFLDYAFITSILKLNIEGSDYQNIKFEGEILNDLSPETERVVRGKNLAEVVSALRTDFIHVIPAISEIYSKGFFDDVEFYKRFDAEQKSRMRTIMQSLFARTNSVFSRSNFLLENNVFINLCLTTDSLFRNQLTHLIQDKQGEFYERNMDTLASYILELNIRKTINDKNSSLSIPVDVNQWLTDVYGFDKNSTGTTLQTSKPIFRHRLEGGDTMHMLVDLQNRKVNIVLEYKKKTYNFTDISTFPEEDQQKFINKIKELSDSLIGTDFVDNPNYWDNFIGTALIAQAEKLYSYIGTILGRIYASNFEINKTKISRQELKNFYGDELFTSIGYDKNNKLINLDGGNTEKNIVSELARAKVVSMGLTMAAQINNSENKAQSLNSFSKLLAAFGIQWNLEERSDYSATVDLDILKGNLFRGVLITNEVVSLKSKRSKKTVSLANSEFAAMNLLIDYIPALYETAGNRIHSNKIARFIASVNSDKNTVDKIAINLAEKWLTEDSRNVDYITAEDSDINDKIKKNLGSYYSKMLNKIYLDFNTLRNAIPLFLALQELESPDINLYPSSGFDFVNNFSSLKTFIAALNAKNKTNYTERQFVLGLLKFYNDKHTDNPLLLVENVAVNYDKKGNLLPASNTLLAQVFRFGYLEHYNVDESGNRTLAPFSDTLKVFFNNPNTPIERKWSTLDQFLEMRELELLSDLIDSNTVFNINGLSETVREGLYKEYSDWVDTSGNLIMFRYNKGTVQNPNWINISTKADFPTFNRLHALTLFGQGKIEINPLIRRLNKLLYLFTQQWMFTTVGSFVAHPLKRKSLEATSTLERMFPWVTEMLDESALFNALCKRNVSFTALMAVFHLNHLYGINEDYNIAVVEDIKKHVDVITSLDGTEATPYDGMTIVDPFTRYLENNALAGNKSSGEVKKTFVHFKNAELGNGGIIKTAVFALTNENMRMSPETNLNLFYKMSGRAWLDENGNELTDFNLLESNLVLDDNGLPTKINFDKLYYTEDGKYYYISDIKYDGNNSYTRTSIEVDKNGAEIPNAQTKVDTFPNVNSNVKAWELFGGIDSMELTKEDGLRFSENSVIAVKDCMNHKGIRLHDGDILNLLDFYQPMKHSLIHYLVTAGAIKQGAANVMQNTTYKDDLELLSYKIKMLLAGTLLDKEHHADLSEVSVPTLVISACAALGYSFYDADLLYEGVAAIADIALKDMTEALREVGTDVLLSPERYSKFVALCTETLVKNLATAKTKNFGTYIAESIIETANAEKSKNAFMEANGLAISDNTIYNRALNIIANNITRTAIKLKMPGNLAIMTPSSGRALLYGDRKFSDYINPFVDLARTLKIQYDTKPLDVADINPDFLYKLTTTTPIKYLINDNSVTVTYNLVLRTYSFLELAEKYDNPLMKEGEKYHPLSIYDDLVTDLDGNTREEPLYVTFSEAPDNSPEGLSLRRILQAIFSIILEKTKTRRKRIRTEKNDEKYERRMRHEAYDEFKDCWNNDFLTLILHVTARINTAKKFDARSQYEIEQGIVAPETRTFVDSEINQDFLRAAVESGKVTKITEYIMNGRDLGAYNVRFKGKFNEDIMSDEEADRILNALLEDELIPDIDENTLKLELQLAEFEHVEDLPLDLRIAQLFAYWDVNREGKINWKSIADEIYTSNRNRGRGRDTERDGYKWFTLVNGGIKLSNVIEKFYENLPEHVKAQHDFSEVKNAVLDYLLTTTLPTKTHAKQAFEDAKRDFLIQFTPSYLQLEEAIYNMAPAKEILDLDTYNRRIQAIKNINRNSESAKISKFNIWDLESVLKCREFSQTEKLLVRCQFELSAMLDELMKRPDLFKSIAISLNKFLKKEYKDNYETIFFEDAAQLLNYLVRSLKAILDKQNQYKEYQLQMRRDLMVLSKASVDAELKLDSFIEALDKGADFDSIYVQARLFIQMLFGTLYWDQDYNSVLAFKNKLNELKNTIAGNLVKIKVGNKTYDVKVDRNTIEHLDYEIIMPKVFATTFGLKPDCVLAEIYNNTNYFIIQNTKNWSSKLDDSKYDLEFKDFKGKHTYIKFGPVLDSEFDDVTEHGIKQMVDESGRRIYLDSDNKPIFEIKEGIKLYRRLSDGVMVISINTNTDENGNVTVDKELLDYYLSHVRGSDIQISNNITTRSQDILNTVLKSVLESKWVELKQWAKNDDEFVNIQDLESILEYLTLQLQNQKVYTEQDVRRALKLINKFKKELNIDDKKANLLQKLKDNISLTAEEALWLKDKLFVDEIQRSKIWIDGRERYNAFIESCKVIAARIPAQSMLSFMAMRVRGFVNGDKNLAYVSDHLIFLLGSDFDIDAVTLLTYDINSQGKLDLWSPFASTIDNKALEASKKLPLPTNKKLDTKEAWDIYDNNGKTKKVKDNLDRNNQVIKITDSSEENFKFFEKYADLLIFKTKDGKIQRVSNKIPKFSRHPDLLINLVNDLLREKSISYPPIRENRNGDSDVSSDVIKLKDLLQSYLSEKFKEPILLTVTDVENIFKALINISDLHNTYFTNKKLVNEDKLHRIINNSNMTSMYRIITDTANLVQSMTSVDGVASEVKDFASLTKKAVNDLFTGTGNSFGIGLMIATNYSGKDCIAKSASSIKTFFKLSHFFNKILNSGDPELLKLLAVPSEIWDNCGNYKPLLSGIRAVDPTKILDNQAVKNILTALESGRLHDAGSLISALLGLSADNAKELVLDKINAGIDLIGLYLYGITVGYDIKTISQLLTSDIVETIYEIMKPDFMTEVNPITIDKVFEYILFGPSSRIGKYHNVYIKNSTLMYSPMVNLVLYLAKDNPKPIQKYDKEPNPLYFMLEKAKNGEMIRVNNSDLALALVQAILQYDDLSGIESRLNMYYANTELNELEKAIYREAINFIKTFTNLRNQIYSSRLSIELFRALLILSVGSQSMLQISKIVSINQGLKTDEAGLLKTISNIEDYLVNQNNLYKQITGRSRYENKEDIPKINLLKFMLSPEYRQLMISEAEKIKVNFNLLAMIDLLPDIRQYFNGLTEADTYFLLKSGRYGFIRNNLAELAASYAIPSDIVIPGLSRLLSSIYIKEYLKYLSKDTSTEKGFRYYKGTMALDTDQGISRFKNYMERYVLPELQKLYPDNKFLKHLSRSSRTNTVDGNAISVLALPIDMMAPEDSNAGRLFNEYKEHFDALTGTFDGNPIQDLFFYYTLIAHEWKPSKNSLMNLFKDKTKGKSRNAVKDYYEFIGTIDNAQNAELLINAYGGIPSYIASHNRFLTPNAEYIYAFNTDTEEYELYQKTEDIQDEEAKQEAEAKRLEAGMGDEEYQGFSIPGYEKVESSIEKAKNPLGIINDVKIKLSKIKYSKDNRYEISLNNGIITSVLRINLSQEKEYKLKLNEIKENLVLLIDNGTIARDAANTLYQLERKKLEAQYPDIQPNSVDFKNFIKMEGKKRLAFDIETYENSLKIQSDENKACNI